MICSDSIGNCVVYTSIVYTCAVFVFDDVRPLLIWWPLRED